MSLGFGTRLGPYEIVSAVGAGGMGEVYRARDTKLGRDVALKVLPESFAADPERVARMQREAQMLAALNHPNIAAIYGFEDSGNVRALVLEYVDGETLADRIARGPISLDEALPIAKQIAEALEAAHEQGIIHRDLKPANIKVRPDGTVKVLDFGLAKLAEPSLTATSPSPLSLSPTITSPALLTGVGVLLGTAAYMPPEQARGKVIDKRADIWAFGCVLYEMLTGARAFDGEDVAVTLGAVIHHEPEWDALSGRSPAALRSLLQRCLQKDPKQRARDIGDVRIELGVIDYAGTAPNAAIPIARSAYPTWIAWTGWSLAIVSSAAAAMLAVAAYVRPSPVSSGPVAFEIFPPANAILSNGDSAVISPDGRSIALRMQRRDNRGLRGFVWIRTLGSLEARPLDGTEDATGIFWSPDSRAIGFASNGGAGNFAGASLKKVDVSGGAPVALANLPGVYRGAVWSRNGTILVALGSGIWKVSDHGGALSQVTASGGRIQTMPAFLPDDRHFIYTDAGPNSANAGPLRVGSIDASPDQQPTTALIEEQAGAIYVPSSNSAIGYVLFERGTSLMAQPFDPARLEFTGGAVALADDLMRILPPFSASTTGALTFRRAGAGDDSNLTWIDRQGKTVAQVGPPGRYGAVRLSPDGTTLVTEAFAEQSNVRRVWTVDLKRDAFTLLDAEGGGSASISPDGSVVYTPNTSGDLFVRSANGADEPELLAKSATVKHADDWSRDGRFIIYDDHHPTRRQDLYIIPMAGDRKPVPFVVTPADETEAAFSPDGRWIAYSSDESGRRDVYVRDFAPDRVPATGAIKVSVSTTGGFKPRWDPHGRELFYLALDGTMMAVPVTGGKTFEPGIPVALFKTSATGFLPYDVSANGRFLINTLSESPGSQSPITVMLNWAAALEK